MPRRPLVFHRPRAEETRLDVVRFQGMIDAFENIVHSRMLPDDILDSFFGVQRLIFFSGTRTLGCTAVRFFPSRHSNYFGFR